MGTLPNEQVGTLRNSQEFRGVLSFDGCLFPPIPTYDAPLLPGLMGRSRRVTMPARNGRYQVILQSDGWSVSTPDGHDVQRQRTASSVARVACSV